MKHLQRTALVAGIVLFAGVVFAANRNLPQAEVCASEADVIAHLDRSRNGISLTCNEDILQRNRANR